MEWKQHHHYPQHIGVHDSGGVEQKTAPQHLHQVASGEIVGKTAVIREQKYDSANEIHHINQHQITHHRQQWRKTIISQKPLYLINHLLHIFTPQI